MYIHIWIKYSRNIWENDPQKSESWGAGRGRGLGWNTQEL
jgi:hypothetical protein